MVTDIKVKFLYLKGLNFCLKDDKDLKTISDARSLTQNGVLCLKQRLKA
ncbi:MULTISPECIES: hypothetical protein [Calothrix]|uniref:Transposase n=1 Tax=Calothrix parietina FACHB-288 TaxID=2692896 RepID=A0ABR8AA60_9CYAN|nr:MULTISPECIES: hypothetical protein [Calothrix]MBD2196773.1 hypothetical protein [Calothrix parietina FACHB-288]